MGRDLEGSEPLHFARYRSLVGPSGCVTIEQVGSAGPVGRRALLEATGTAVGPERPWSPAVWTQPVPQLDGGSSPMRRAASQAAASLADAAITASWSIPG